MIIIIALYNYISGLKKYNVLVADIGGTHIRFKLLKMTKNPDDEIETIDTTRLKTSDYESLEVLLKEYLSNIATNYPEIAVIGVPGPIQDNKIMNLPNIPHWKKEDGNELGKILNIKKFLFLNDFACNSYGVQTKLVLNKDYSIINQGEPNPDGAIALLGPGTGLGMGYLMKNKNDKYYIIGNSEGGHQFFASKNKELFELVEFVKKEYNLNYVIKENICSGQGMVPLYKFLLQKEIEEKGINGVERDKVLGERVDNFHNYSDKKTRDELSNEITIKGVKGECPFSRKVVDYFIKILADIATDLSFMIFPSNGIYLLGGISVNLEPFIKETNNFMEYYLDNDLKFILKKFPIYLVKNGNIGMIGAAEAARRILEKEEEKEK